MMQYLMHRHVRVGSGWNIFFVDNFGSMMAVRYYRLGIYLEYGCDFTNKVLEKVSDKIE